MAKRRPEEIGRAVVAELLAYKRERAAVSSTATDKQEQLLEDHQTRVALLARCLVMPERVINNWLVKESRIADNSAGESRYVEVQTLSWLLRLTPTLRPTGDRVHG